jgi:cell volume regulation protein A
VEVGAVRELGGDVIEHVIRPGDAAAGARIRELGLPRDALVSLVARGDEARCCPAAPRAWRPAIA